ncbi:MAG: ABC transporter ATP-binding protein [Bacillota bacterium]|nr:ABC transporter ATP-binding protein [Bacillota bacterium]
MPEELLLEVHNLKKYFPTGQKGVYVRAVDGVNFELRRGEVLALVGESGSGKSTTAYTVLGIYQPTAGQVLFKGRDISAGLWRRPLAVKKDIQIVFQDPGTSLNPSRTIAQILGLPLAVHGIGSKADRQQKIIDLLRLVELPPDFMYKYPGAVGGGERQMVAIARALATNPSLLVLDEPTSALDVSVQAKIVNMLIRLQQDLHLAYLFITHDLSVMRNVATRVAIMYLGKICETAPVLELFSNPVHPYTQMLLSSIPVVSKAEEAVKTKKIQSTGEIPSPVRVPPGCGFHPRCPLRVDLCVREDPQMHEVRPGHFARCHLLAGEAMEGGNGRKGGGGDGSSRSHQTTA